MSTDVNLCTWCGGDVTVSDSKPRSRKEEGYPPGEKIQGPTYACTSGDYWEARTSTGSEPQAPARTPERGRAVQDGAALWGRVRAQLDGPESEWMSGSLESHIRTLWVSVSPTYSPGLHKVIPVNPS